MNGTRTENPHSNVVYMINHLAQHRKSFTEAGAFRYLLKVSQPYPTDSIMAHRTTLGRKVNAVIFPIWGTPNYGFLCQMVIYHAAP